MWVRVDDQMHHHRKTRLVTKSDPSKRRDAHPMGLWLLAASWAGQNNTEGWVPEDELDRWDDDWPELAQRLVHAGYWWPHEKDGEPGYGFNDWHDYNDPADAASKAGTYGNHVRWHVNEKKVDPECKHCPKEPDEPEDQGDVAPDIGGRSGGDSLLESGGESRFASGAIALPEPEPLSRPEPEPEPGKLFADESAVSEPDRFDEFWTTYSKPVGKKASKAEWVRVKKRADQERVITAAATYAAATERQYRKDPIRWLKGDHWNDEPMPRHLRVASRQQETNDLFDRALARAQERDQADLGLPAIGGDL